MGVPFACVGLLLLLERTSLDTRISDWFFDPVAGVFPLHYNALLEIVGHQILKEAVVVLACILFALYLISFFLPALRPRRRVLLYLWLALAVAPLSVTLLKAGSVRHCPWDLQQYGGFAPHLSLFDAAPPGMPPGRCFPSGHASAGYGLLAFYFAGLALGNRRLALAGFWGGLAAGTLFGIIRIAQGAHFLSHNLWSALVCWLVVLALYVRIFQPFGNAQDKAALAANPG